MNLDYVYMTLTESLRDFGCAKRGRSTVNKCHSVIMFTDVDTPLPGTEYAVQFLPELQISKATRKISGIPEEPVNAAGKARLELGSLDASFVING